MEAVVTRGRLELRSIIGSVDASTMNIEIDMRRADGVLTLGDLRLAAEEYEALGCHEAAHRLWTAVGRAAGTVEADELFAYAAHRAADAIARVDEQVGQRFRRSGVRFDYLAMAASRADGVTASEVATSHGCSTRTVARAVEFAQERARLLERHPGLTQNLTVDANPDLLAAHYGIEPKVMRWILALSFDRRRT